ncbi:MAG: hypothetical protein MRY79_02165 [Alphaproteobacteria bacterium]|nr:hypothetical protein [Alphaproteobacteria bacterium]
MLNNFISVTDGVKNLTRYFTGASDNKKPKTPKILKFATFRIEDPEAEKAICTWKLQSGEDHKIIQKFVRDKFSPVLYRSNPAYILDLDGKLAKVNYAGMHPPGWRGIPGINWLEPESSEAFKEIKDLPTPALRNLHNMIIWPVFEDRFFNEDERREIERINQMMYVHSDANHVYIDILDIENFEEFPKISALMNRWQKPEWLTRCHHPRDTVKKVRKSTFDIYAQ